MTRKCLNADGPMTGAERMRRWYAGHKEEQAERNKASRLRNYPGSNKPAPLTGERYPACPLCHHFADCNLIIADELSHKWDEGREYTPFPCMPK